MATAPSLGGNLHELNEIKYLQYVIFADFILYVCCLTPRLIIFPSMTSEQVRVFIVHQL